jgi:site-specific recombinase XerC
VALFLTAFDNLGHTKLATTEIYAEKDLALVEKIALEMG